MLKLNKPVFCFHPGSPFYSEDVLTSPVEIDGVIHHMGERKIVNISAPEYAEDKFPKPEDYTLDNLIKSGAPLEEVPSPLAGVTPAGVEVAAIDAVEFLQNDNNFNDKDN